MSSGLWHASHSTDWSSTGLETVFPTFWTSGPISTAWFIKGEWAALNLESSGWDERSLLTSLLLSQTQYVILLLCVISFFFPVNTLKFTAWNFSWGKLTRLLFKQWLLGVCFLKLRCPARNLQHSLTKLVNQDTKISLVQVRIFSTMTKIHLMKHCSVK